MTSISNLSSLSALAKAAKNNHGKTVLTVPVNDVISKKQVRKKFTKIEELASSILVEGQQSPIIVYPQNADGKYVIQKGERRWRACVHGNVPTIDIIVNNKKLTSLDEIAGELIENIHRDDLTPMEVAEALYEFVEEGWPQKQIANRIGKKEPFVSMHLALLKLPECIKQLYDDEISADVDTLNNLRQIYAIDQERCVEMCVAANVEGITRKQTRDVLNGLKRKNIETVDVLPPPAANSAANNKTENPKKDAPPAEKGSRPQTTSVAEQGSGWRDIDPSQLVISVNAFLNGELIAGSLVTNRLGHHPGKVWISIPDDNDDYQMMEVDIGTIELVNISI